jgi:hypothetical protein
MKATVESELKVCRNQCFIETCIIILNRARFLNTAVIKLITVVSWGRAPFNIFMQVSIKHSFLQTFNLNCTYSILSYDLMEHTFECGPSSYFGFVNYQYNVDNPFFVNTIMNISSIQCYTLRKLISRNQGYLPTFSVVQSTNLSTIADSIQRRQSESVRSIAGAHKHRK